MSLQERTLVVKGFDPDKTTPALLKELCLQGGPVRNVVVKPDHAFIEYEDVESVGYSKALLEGVELFGKKLAMETKIRNSSHLRYSKLLHDYIIYDKQQRNQQQQLQFQQQQFQVHQQMLASYNNQNPGQQAQFNNLPQQFEQNPSFPINFVNAQVIDSPTTFQQNNAEIFSGQNQQTTQIHQQMPSHQILPNQMVFPPRQMPPQNIFLQPNLQRGVPARRPNDNTRRSRFNHQSNRHRGGNDWNRRK